MLTVKKIVTRQDPDADVSGAEKYKTEVTTAESIDVDQTHSGVVIWNEDRVAICVVPAKDNEAGLIRTEVYVTDAAGQTVYRYRLEHCGSPCSKAAA